MRLESELQSKRQQSTNQWLKTHVTILVICCLLTKVVTGRHVNNNGHGATKDGKQRNPRQLDDKANIECDTVDDAYHQPHFSPGRSVMVQLFEWKFVDVAKECREFLGPQGYGGVQLSPVLEHTVIKTDELNHPWWERYETISYRLASRSGDESEFWSMSRICNDHGVRIYVDVVLNHMAAPLHILLNETITTTSNEEDFTVSTLLDDQVNIANSTYPNVPYTAQDFHRPCAIQNTPSAHEIRNCQLNGHPDLDHYQASVQQHLVEMLNKFIDMGVAGFRIDLAKHIWPIDLKHINEQLKDLNTEFGFEAKARPLMFHDVFDMGLDAVSKTEYSTYGVVSEYLYGAELSTILLRKASLSSLINWGPAMGFIPHQDSVIFIDTHETQRGLPHELGHNRIITYKQPHKYIMANALMLTHPYGRIKRLMSSYYFDEMDVNQGPPTEDGDADAIRSPEFTEEQQCSAASGWVCEHRWPPLVKLVEFNNYFSIPGQEEESIIHFQTNGPNHVAFCRGTKAFVAMNNDPENHFELKVFTCLEQGMYCDIISGGLDVEKQECHGRSLEVNAEGYANLNLPAVRDQIDSATIQFAKVDDVEENGIVEESKLKDFGVLVVYVDSKIGKEKKAEDKEGSEMTNGGDDGKQEEQENELEVDEKGVDDTHVDKDEVAENEDGEHKNEDGDESEVGASQETNNDEVAVKGFDIENQNPMGEGHEFAEETDLEMNEDDDEAEPDSKQNVDSGENETAGEDKENVGDEAELETAEGNEAEVEPENKNVEEAVDEEENTNVEEEVENSESKINNIEENVETDAVNESVEKNVNEEVERVAEVESEGTNAKEEVEGAAADESEVKNMEEEADGAAVNESEDDTVPEEAEAAAVDDSQVKNVEEEVKGAAVKESEDENVEEHVEGGAVDETEDKKVDEEAEGGAVNEPEDKNGEEEAEGAAVEELSSKNLELEIKGDAVDDVTIAKNISLGNGYDDEVFTMVPLEDETKAAANIEEETKIEQDNDMESNEMIDENVAASQENDEENESNVAETSPGDETEEQVEQPNPEDAVVSEGSKETAQDSETNVENENNANTDEENANENEQELVSPVADSADNNAEVDNQQSAMADATTETVEDKTELQSPPAIRSNDVQVAGIFHHGSNGNG